MVCVRPGVLLTRARPRRPASALMALDLPTLERPAKAISGGPGGGRSEGRAAARRNCASEKACVAVPKGANSNKIPPFVRGYRRMMRALALAAGMAVLYSGTLAAQNDAKQNTAKAQGIATQVCAACHGSDGNSPAPANPKIAGQFPEYLHKQLADFRPQSGKKAARDNAIMAGMVANLSDADMKGLAAYFSGQKLKPAAATDKDLAALGQKLWRGGNAASGVPACSGCHGPSGAGIPAQYPRIAGQYADYIAAQLKAFREGARTNDQNGMMRGVAARLSDREIRAVAEYAAGLR